MISRFEAYIPPPNVVISLVIHIILTVIWKPVGRHFSDFWQPGPAHASRNLSSFRQNINTQPFSPTIPHHKLWYGPFLYLEIKPWWLGHCLFVVVICFYKYKLLLICLSVQKAPIKNSFDMILRVIIARNEKIYVSVCVVFWWMVEALGG